MNHPILGDELWVVGNYSFTTDVPDSSEIFELVAGCNNVAGTFDKHCDAVAHARRMTAENFSFSRSRHFRPFKVFLKFGGFHD